MSLRTTARDFYRPPYMGAWKKEGLRIDSTTDPLAFRWHQFVRPGPLVLGDDGRPVRWDWSAHGGPTGHRPYALIGCATDAGVIRNLGRPGAVQGPEATRQQLAPFPYAYGPVDLIDAGDIVFPEASIRDVAEVQQAVADSVRVLLTGGAFPIVMGGGNEISFGTGRAVYDWALAQPRRPRIGIVLWDAHFDLRSVEERGVTSGTPFWQLAQRAKELGIPFHYMVIGIRRAANTPRLFATAAELGATIVFADQLLEMNLPLISRTMDAFLAQVDAVYETVDMDVFNGGSAPGVSAVNPDGIFPGPLFYRLFDHVTQSGKLVAFETTELSPPNDAPDGRTAKLAAALIDRVVYERETRISSP